MWGILLFPIVSVHRVSKLIVLVDIFGRDTAFFDKISVDRYMIDVSSKCSLFAPFHKSQWLAYKRFGSNV